MAFVVCWALFVNHYCRDVTGALETEIEAHFVIEKKQYDILNSMYFLPNLFTSLLTGVIAQRIGGVETMCLVVLLSVVGHILVGVGGSLASYPVLLSGRVVLGLCYESIDMMPLPILGKDFADVWAFLSGVFNGFLRMGSVTNFVLSPIIFERTGLAGALWASTAFGCSALVTCAIMWRLHRHRQQEALSALSEEPFAGNPPAAVNIEMRPGLASFPKVFWCYCLCGTLMYSGIVPFWFFGSRYLQERFGQSLQQADTLMMLPEGMIALLSPLIGIVFDRSGIETRTKLQMLAGSLLFFPASYAVLLSDCPPLWPMILLGSGWAFSNCIFWACVTVVCPRELLGLGAGIIGTALNIGATVLPFVMGQISDVASMLLLISVSLLAAMVAVLTVLALPATSDAAKAYLEASLQPVSGSVIKNP